MTTTIDCDRVFDVLTRGPFHADDADDRQVELHLAGCHECRQLAEALRPAVDLFHESIDADEADALPSYRGGLPSAQSDRMATAVATAIACSPLHAARPAPWRKSTQRTWDGAARLAGPALVGAALCALVWIGVAPDRGAGSLTAGDDQPAPLLSARYAPDARGLAWLQSLELSAACLAPARLAARVPAPAPASLHAFQCCAQCHSPASDELTPARAIGTAARSCNACHKLAVLIRPSHVHPGDALPAALSLVAADV